MEFKLKTSENYLKSNKKNLGQYEIADFYQIKRKNLQKQLIESLKSIKKKAGTVRGVRAHTPKNHEKTLKIELFASFVWNLS